MQITRRSIWDNSLLTRTLPITVEQYLSWVSGTLIQDAFPHLSADDREWFLTGMTPEQIARRDELLNRTEAGEPST